MKTKDIALVTVIVLISAVISFFVSKMLFGSPKNRQQEAEVVQAITADFKRPDERYYNSEAFDPTKVIRIGDDANTNPFSGSSR